MDIPLVPPFVFRRRLNPPAKRETYILAGPNKEFVVNFKKSQTTKYDDFAMQVLDKLKSGVLVTKQDAINETCSLLSTNADAD